MSLVETTPSSSSPKPSTKKSDCRENRHCLHARTHLAVSGGPGHRDHMCCWCGHRRCHEQNIEWPGMREHGPFVAVDFPLRHRLYRKPDVVGYDRLKVRDKLRHNKEYLSEANLRVLRRLAQGEDREEAAKNLELHPVTIDFHQKDITKKLGSKTFIQAVVESVRKGYI